MIIAMDGPAGAGKSTVARRVAQALGFLLIDTGAIYRTVGLAATRAGVSLEDDAAVGSIARAARIALDTAGETTRVTLDGEDVSVAIRTPAASDAASRVSALPSVRAALLELQRELGRRSDAVLEGRDIGTVVFPEAELKVFLTATPVERARRRLGDYGGASASRLAEVEAEIRERDARDMAREIAPLRRADDAVEIVTDGMTVDAVVEEIVELARSRGASKCVGSSGSP